MDKLEERYWNRYMCWLLKRVGFLDENYDLLMEALHNTTFIFTIERDQNRAEDGIYLREIYLDLFANGYDLPEDFEFHKDVSVLEMLVALACRMENEYVGDPGDPHPERIFWQFLVNLGFEGYTNRKIRVNLVAKNLENWMMRQFDFHGNGGIFPVKRPMQDQRKVEIWSQMQEYIDENY